MADLSPRIQKLSESYATWRKSLEPTGEGAATIGVDEVASRVAAFYERIRGIVDWREEHLLRKMAIHRILHRRLLLSEHPQEIAEPLLHELVRGGHFPNNSLLAEEIEEVQKIISKYVLFIEQNREKTTPRKLKPKDKRSLEDWLLLLAAAEIEERLHPPIREQALGTVMKEDLEDRLLLPGIQDQEKRLQVALAAEGVLFKSDDATLTLHLLQTMEPAWKYPSLEKLAELAQNIHGIRKATEQILTHPLGERIRSFSERHAIPYLILGDLTEQAEDFSLAYQDPAALEQAAVLTYEQRLRKLRGKLKRAAFYSTVSIFLTKILLSIIIEVPLDRTFVGHVNTNALIASIVTPPLLMVVLLSSMRPSPKENLQRVVMEVMRIVYGKEKPEPIQIQGVLEKKSVLGAVVSATYVLSFAFSFGLILWGLAALRFSLTSSIIFLVFLSLVAFAGTRIRKNARELLVIEEKHTFLDGLFDFFSLPLVYAGKWLSGQIVRYNIILLVINFLIEIPFQVFVEFLEQWRAFLREKREKIR
ncbi:MAG: hypothetical protein HY458_02640 [Parcubacteria group bacterium]|nr:hypothetical protein [Parcubacteria group bacterium]